MAIVNEEIKPEIRNKPVKDPEFYIRKDLGEIYQAIHTATPQELGVIYITAVKLGHAGLFDRVYEVRTLKKLEELEADSQDIELFRQAILNNDLHVAFSIAEKYNIEKPPRKDVAQTLLNASQLRGFSIDNRETSVGSLYQRLFGTDFLQGSWTIEEEGVKKQVNYEELLRIIPGSQECANKQCLNDRLGHLQKELGIR